uniref:GHITM_0 protein n=1 Tax=Fopius arisanus TaxID=64838 RepID=A0A0C9QSZ8_9HYME
MLLARVCKATIAPQVSSLLKTPVVAHGSRVQVARLFGNEGRSTFSRAARNRGSLVEDAVKPTAEKAFNIGRGFVAGSAVLGLGALCYYGAGLSPTTGAIDHAALWPQYVKDRIHTTYMYFGGSVLASGAAAAACLRSPTIMRMVTQGGWVAMGVSLAAMIGTSILTTSIPYQEGFGPKQMAWLLHCGVIGAVLAPMSLLGGALVVRAAIYTAGVVGGLSAVAVCAPSDKFLSMAAPLGIGFGVVFVSSLGSIFLPPTTALGSGLYAISLYGGLVLFSMYLLYDTQKLIRQAETHPAYDRQYDYAGNAVRSYDPVNNAMHIYMDTVNIFVRILSILAGGGSRRK